MSGEAKEDPQAMQQIETNEDSLISCEFPKVVLTRIDVENLPTSVQEHQPAENKAVKKIIARPSKTKPSSKQKLSEKKKQQTKKVSPNKFSNMKAKATKQNILPSVKSPSSGSLGSIKDMLNKTAIQNRSTNSAKTAIQNKSTTSAKKYKTVSMKPSKESPVKNKSQSKLKNIEVRYSKTKDTESSEDEFLYDELIDELENSSKAKESMKTMFEKTTNIKLKQNTLNKTPTVVKGGIIKRTKLPPGLRSVSESTPNPLKTVKRTNNNASSQSPTKKVSPWPISISPVEKINKKQSEKIAGEPPQLNFKPPQLLKPRIGPKQTLKVGPLFNSNTEDNSDEYSEIETLENDDVDVRSSSKLLDSSRKTTTNQNTPSTPFNSSKDEDPNLDLIRILSDDVDYAYEMKSSLNSGNRTENKETNSSHIKESTEMSPVEMDNPPVRTIYELMNEISLQHPSWNLHIIPETNAFCIAQVTKGRLGIPTMKKCIELDSTNYYARVYIHQYHIKKFDGWYDSEDSILSLFQEINAIKA